jgi:hypothetical protein
VDIVAQMLVQSHGNCSINFVVHIYEFTIYNYIGILPCFLAGRASRLVAS